MKYRIIGAVCFSVVLVLALILPFLISEESDRFHQHTDSAKKAECTDHGDGVFCTHLPLVEIETGGREIPGLPILDENMITVGYTTAEDGSDTVTVSVSMTDHAETYNHTDDAAEIETLAQIRVRGHSSRHFAKLGYDLRLVFENGENDPQSVMGMDAHHEWILHGPYLDKSLIRNYLWYNIAGEVMDYSPNVRFCEVFIDGEYRGIYLMTESVTEGKDGARLDLSVDKKDSSFSGYLLRLDRGSGTDIKNLNTFSMYSGKTWTSFNVEYPGTANLTEELRRSIELDFSAFEKSLYSFDYDSSEYGYPAQIDAENFAEYFVINEIACNYDAGIYSTFIYKDTDGLFNLCVWDFNNSCDNYQENYWSGEGFAFPHRLWYVMLLKSEDFTELCISKYRELRETVLSDSYLEEYIDGTIDYLGEAAERNFEVWGSSFTEELLYPAERNIGSFEEAVEQLKGFIKKRTQWLDENIDTLSQYSAGSKTKKFNEATK